MGSEPTSVSAELEAIFVGATGLPSSRAARLPPSRKLRSLTPGQPRRSRIPIAGLGAAAAAAIVVLCAGAALVRIPAPPPLAPRPPLPVVINDAAPAAEPAPAEPPLVTLADANGSPSDLAAPKLHPMAVARAPKAVAAARRPTHADLMLADRRLRRAYEQAIDAGVPRPVLASYRDRWADLRHDASWRPERVQQGYEAMAGDLTRLSAHRRARHAPRHRGLRSLW